MKIGKRINKEHLRDYLTIAGLAIVFAFVYILLTRNQYIYGSTIDWQNQHYLIPDYFRQLFYQTKEIIPSLALHLGSGQNIFYFSYYGLLSPIILLSYFLPYINMADFIIFSTLILTYSSVVLFYYYLKSHKCNYATRLLLTIIFMCAGPLIYQTHRQIMFINYMPFLILALFGVDRIIKKEQPLLLIVSFLMIILTSYYFSISSAVMLFLYYTFQIFRESKLNFKTYFKKCFKIIIPIIIAFLISAVLIAPTAYCLLNSRAGNGMHLNILSLLKPHIRGYNALYSYNSMGFMAFPLIGLIYTLITKEKNNRWLGIVLLILIYIPIGCYILNGTLYTDPKALIPFIPLMLFYIKDFVNDFIINKIDYKKLFMIIMILVLGSFNHYLIIDALGILLITKVFRKHYQGVFIYVSILVFGLMIGFNLSDKLVTKKDYLEVNNAINKEIFETINNDEIYRVNNQIGQYSNFNYLASLKQYNATMYSSSTNKRYSKFYYDDTSNNIPYRTRAMLVSTDNPLFQIYMGEKYILSDKDKMFESDLIDSNNNIRLFKKKFVLPIGYASNHLMKKSTYQKLKNPNRILALLSNIITDNSEENVISLNYIDSDFTIVENKNLTYQLKDKKLNVKSKKNGHLKIKINDNINNPIVIVRFNNKTIPQCKDEEYQVSINGIKNRISAVNWKYYNKNTRFDYVIHDTLNLDMEFMKGKYDFTDFRIYVLDYDKLIDSIDDFDSLIINAEETKGNKLMGNINVTNDGYFKLSIPYDQGYTVRLNNKKVNYEIVDDNFIGFSIKKGQYQVIVTFEAPYLKEGKIISLCGLLLSIIYIIIKKIRH